MKKGQKEAILISFLNEKGKYKNLAEYIVRLIKDDPLLPKESMHTVAYRIKNESRLIEKIDILNKELEAGVLPIRVKNYQARVGDLLGIRIICLRLSDVEKIESYLQLLSEEDIFTFVKGPDHKRSFILPDNPGASMTDGLDLRYSGYSSIHYQIELGENTDAPPESKGLQFELQLRTILEEAWSEIDHKYRYMRSRIGVNLPDYINTGFYNLSAYLQVAALQAENLCRMAESRDRHKVTNVKGVSRTLRDDAYTPTEPIKDTGRRQSTSSEIEKGLEKILRIKITPRTLIYVEKRLRDIKADEKPHKTLQMLLTKRRILEFKKIFKEIFDAEPFKNVKESNIDLINALNFSIFYKLQGKRVAQEGLRAVLRWRKDQSGRRHPVGGEGGEELNCYTGTRQ
jgi:ppGpp synthetase/RelA/SpoT-type nucleotidyltranferase